MGDCSAGPQFRSGRRLPMTWAEMLEKKSVSVSVTAADGQAGAKRTWAPCDVGQKRVRQRPADKAPFVASVADKSLYGS